MSVAALRRELQLLGQIAESHARNFILDTEPDEETLADSIADFMGVYCDAGALMAADFYNSADRDSRYFARPESVVPPKRATDTARWVFKGAQAPTVDNVARKMAAAAYSMVFDAARDTVSANAVAEEVAYVRVEEQGACDDCKRLATLKPRARNSGSDDVAWERHQRCEFLFEPVRRGIWTPPSYATEWGARETLPTR